MDCPTWDGVILAAAAVIAAALAAWTANHRMKRQLDEESMRLDRQLEAEAERLDGQLKAERERLQDQLSHDRETKERSELRGTLDEGAELIGKAWSIIRAIRRQSEPAPDASSAEEAARENGRFDALKEAADVYDEFTGYWQRLLLRFEMKDPIVESVDTAMTALNAAAKIHRRPLAKVSPEGQREFEDQAGTFDEAHADFLLECRRRFGIGGIDGS